MGFEPSSALETGEFEVEAEFGSLWEILGHLLAIGSLVWISFRP